jgi:hypothetical protein
MDFLNVGSTLILPQGLQINREFYSSRSKAEGRIKVKTIFDVNDKYLLSQDEYHKDRYISPEVEILRKDKYSITVKASRVVGLYKTVKNSSKFDLSKGRPGYFKLKIIFKLNKEFFNE